MRDGIGPTLATLAMLGCVYLIWYADQGPAGYLLRAAWTHATR